jgi:histidine triad (HIT) family protein
MGCTFCDIVEKRRPSTPVYEDERIYAFRDINPQAPSHILVVPKKHVSTVNDLGEEDAELVGKLVLKARDLAREEGAAEKGYRLVMNCNPWGGQSVYHVHFHLLSGRALRSPLG